MSENMLNKNFSFEKNNNDKLVLDVKSKFVGKEGEWITVNK